MSTVGRVSSGTELAHWPNASGAPGSVEACSGGALPVFVRYLKVGSPRQIVVAWSLGAMAHLANKLKGWRGPPVPQAGGQRRSRPLGHSGARPCLLVFAHVVHTPSNEYKGSTPFACNRHLSLAESWRSNRPDA
jgi:hypothetical protein